jgi:RNA polymerase sigma factor (sigma-70 family)
VTDDDLARNVVALRSFAHSLAHGIDADDLVQDVAVAALHRGARPDRAWLRAVMRRVAALGWRRRQRQLARDARLVPESATTLDDEAFRAQLLDALQEALRELDAPSREALRDRYIEGHTAAEIANRAGCPASTIRSRLSAAIEHLRRGLDRRFGGRAQWCPALAFAADPSPSHAVAWSFALAAAAVAVAIAIAVTSSVEANERQPAPESGTLVARMDPIAATQRVAPVPVRWRSVPDDEGSARRGDAIARARATRTSRDAALDDAKAEDAVLEGKHFSKVFKSELMPLIRECHETRRAVVPDLAGRFGGAFYLLAADDIGIIVEDVEFPDENELHDPEFLECVRQSAFSMPFPPTTATGHNKVRVFLEFE